MGIGIETSKPVWNPDGKTGSFRVIVQTIHPHPHPDPHPHPHQRLVLLYNNPKPSESLRLESRLAYWFQFLGGCFDLQDAFTIQVES